MLLPFSSCRIMVKVRGSFVECNQMRRRSSEGRLGKRWKVVRGWVGVYVRVCAGDGGGEVIVECIIWVDFNLSD